jgi:hypothetical protein
MLVTFKCDAYPNITMLDDVAIPLLKIMGHNGSVPGAIIAKDVPAALARLKNAFKQENKSVEQSRSTSQNKEKVEEEDVSMGTHAFPLIELFSCAAKENCNILWDTATKIPF